MALWALLEIFALGGSLLGTTSARNLRSTKPAVPLLASSSRTHDATNPSAVCRFALVSGHDELAGRRLVLYSNDLFLLRLHVYSSFEISSFLLRRENPSTTVVKNLPTVVSTIEGSLRPT